MERSEQGSIKGGVLLSRLSLLRQRGGEACVARVLGRLTPQDRALVSGVVLPFGWYPFGAGSRFDEAIAAELGEGIFRELGAASAADNLGDVHKSYVRSGDPHGLLKQAPSIYRLYYDSGYRTYERLGDRKAMLRTFDSTTFTRTDCLTIAGWYEKAIELCGGQRARVTELRCRSQGDPLCEYRCEWE